MEFVIIATVVLVLAMCLGADFVIVPIMFIVFLVILLLAIFSFFVYSAVKLTGTKSVKGKFVRFGGDDDTFSTNSDRLELNDFRQ